MEFGGVRILFWIPWRSHNKSTRTCVRVSANIELDTIWKLNTKSKLIHGWLLFIAYDRAIYALHMHGDLVCKLLLLSVSFTYSFCVRKREKTCLSTYCRSSSIRASTQTCCRFGLDGWPISNFASTTGISRCICGMRSFLFVLISYWYIVFVVWVLIF